MPEMLLRELSVLGKPGFTYISCGLLTKSNEKIQNF